MKLRLSNRSCHRYVAVLSTVVAVSALQSHQPRIRVAAQSASPRSAIEAAKKTRLAATYGQLPLAFEENQGQTAEEVKFLSRGAGYTVFLASDEAVLRLRKASHDSEEAVVRMKLRGGLPASRVSGRGELPGKINYLNGRDPAKWRRGVTRFERVEYENVYRGINLVYYGNQRQLEYDFIVSPGADPENIRLAFEGVHARRIDDRGDLVLETRTDPVRLQRPVIYQEVDGGRQQIAGAYVLEDTGDVTFQVGAYDTTRPLVIDPVLVYSTFLGGTGYDFALDIAVDPTGSAYVVGNTQSPDFPVNNAVQPTCRLLEMPGYNSCDDVFVTKLSPDGTAIEYSTYIGGTNSDVGNGIAVDGFGSAYVTGMTWSGDLPTVNAIQPDFRSNPTYLADAFVVKLSSNGSELIYSTYLGGSDEDRGNAIAVDEQGSAYITGGTGSANFPTAGPLQSAPAGSMDVFVAKLTPDGSALAYSTFLGGQGYDIANDVAVSDEGHASIVGETTSIDFPTVNASQPMLQGGNDAFIATVVPDGTALVHSSYLGGPGFDWGWRLAVLDRNYYVTGTTSGDFPVTEGPPVNGPSDAFVAIVSFEGLLSYGRYFGGAFEEQGLGIAVDPAGNFYVAGVTRSPDFPLRHPIQEHSGNEDFFIAKLNSAHEVIYSTYLGGQGVEIGADSAILRGPSVAVDSAGNAYVAGATSSLDFPSTGAIFQPALRGAVDAVVAKIFDDGTSEARADLSVAEMEVEEGEGEIRYLFTITNHGPSPASEVTFHDDLPFGVTPTGAFIVTAWGGSGTCALDSHITCYLGAVPVGASAQVGLTMTSPTQPEVINFALVTATETDPDLRNNTIESTRQMPDVAMGGSAEQHGSDLHYLFRFANFGPGRANVVRFTNVVPEGATVRSALFGLDSPTGPVTSSCGVEERIVTCGVDTLPAGATAFAEIVITPAGPGSLISTGTVTSGTPDYNLINNSVTLTTTFGEAHADLSISHSQSKSVVMVGDTLTYTFDVANNGPAEATDVFLSDELSDSEALASVVTDRGGCDSASSFVYCSFGSLPAGAVARVTVVVNVVRYGSESNRVSVWSSVNDPNPNNNDAAIVTPVNRPPVANAGLDQLVSVGGTCQAPVTLNGSGSSDPDGDTLTYSWTSAGSPPFPPIVLSEGGGAATGPTPAAPLAPGVYTIVLTVSDGRGGSASDTAVVTVRDTTPPVFTSVPAPITVEQSSPAGTLVTVPLATAIDNCPGPLFVSIDVSPVSPPGPVMFPPGSTTVTFRTCDAHCNRASATTTVTVVDTTRPSVTVTSPQPRDYLHSEILAIDFSAADAGSGLASGSPGATLDGTAVANGQSIALLTLALGQHSLLVSAVDGAGNTVSQPVTFRVIANVGSLIAAVNVFVGDGAITDSNTANGLLAKLTDAQDAIDKGKNNVAVNKLREFIDQVNGRAGRSVATHAAQLLVTDAGFVIGTLQ